MTQRDRLLVIHQDVKQLHYVRCNVNASIYRAKWRQTNTALIIQDLSIIYLHPYDRTVIEPTPEATQMS